MADTAKVLVRRAKKVGVVGFGSLAVSAALLGFGAGTASADELAPDPAAPGGQYAEDGVRPSGWQEYEAIQTNSEDGIRSSNIAIPATTGHAPEPGDLSAGLDECLFNWAGC